MNKIESQLYHEIDIAWIIAIWKAIHGGDPAPEQNYLTRLLAESLVTQMGAQLATHDRARIFEKFKALGVKIQGRDPNNKVFELQSQADVKKFAEVLSTHNSPGHPLKGYLVCVHVVNEQDGCCVGGGFHNVNIPG